MHRRNNPLSFRRSIVANVVPAYLGPAAMVSINARLVPNHVTGRALGHAALTTIAVPSALAALTVSLVMCRPGARHTQRSLGRTILTIAVGCGLLAALVSGFLVGNGFVAQRLLLDAIPSAMISGAITSAKVAKARKRSAASIRVNDGEPTQRESSRKLDQPVPTVCATAARP